MRNRILLLITFLGLTVYYGCRPSTGPSLSAPVISRFSPDTAWTSPPSGVWDKSRVTVHGRNFGTSPGALEISVASQRADIHEVSDTALYFYLPMYATTDYIKLKKGSEVATSPTKLTVFRSLLVNEITPDSGSAGTPIRVFGTGFTTAPNSLHLFLNNLEIGLDSVLEDHITFTIPEKAATGALQLFSNSEKMNMYLYVTRGRPWQLFAVNYENVIVDARHSRKGYQNGPGHSIDSTWWTTDTMNHEYVHALGKLLRSDVGVYHALSADGDLYNFSFAWDTVNSSATVQLYFEARTATQLPAAITLDSGWGIKSTYTFPLSSPVDREITQVIPNDNLFFRTSRHEADRQQNYDWQEEVIGTIRSGRVTLRLIQ